MGRGNQKNTHLRKSLNCNYNFRKSNTETFVIVKTDLSSSRMTGQTGRAFHKLLEIFQKVSHYFSNNCSKVAKNNQKLLIATKLTQTVAQKQNLCLVWSYENMQIVQTKVRFLRIFVQFFQRNQRCLITFSGVKITKEM